MVYREDWVTGGSSNIELASKSGYLKRLWASRPETSVVLRDDRHLVDPELIQPAFDEPHTDFIVGLTANRYPAPLQQDLF